MKEFVHRFNFVSRTFFLLNSTKYFNIRASCFHKLNRSICLKNLPQKIFWFSFLTNCNCIKLLAARLIKCRSCFNNLYSILRPRKTKLIYWTDQAGSNVCDCIGEIASSLSGAACCVQRVSMSVSILIDVQCPHRCCAT